MVGAGPRRQKDSKRSSGREHQKPLEASSVGREGQDNARYPAGRTRAAVVCGGEHRRKSGSRAGPNMSPSTWKFYLLCSRAPVREAALSSSVGGTQETVGHQQ